MSQRKNLIVVALFWALFAGNTFAQQPQAPSQRFNPEVPPSVHVPDANVRSLNSRKSGSTNLNFSDTPASSFRQPQATRRVQNNGRAQNNGRVQQVAYQEDPNQLRENLIPAVLRESSIKQKNKVPADNFQAPKKKIHQLRSMPKPPSQIANQTARQNNGGIVVDKSQFSSHNQQLRSTTSAPAQMTEPTQAPQQPAAISRIPAAQMINTTKSVQPVAFSQQLNQENDQVRSAEFNTTQSNSSVPAIKTVAAESETIATGASIQMSAPAIQVQVFGPETIGVNKIATYKITVSNDGNHDAKELRVSLGIPDSVELQNINVSTGHHEIGNEAELTRLIWNIDRIQAGVTHTIALNTIARSADPFDLDVKWESAPQVSSTQVTVTEPKLEMKISGAAEVMFGEKATYDVTISNPGTGVAEQVSVMLPQELGGERANIGDIEAGGEKRFKVELLARTAGRLNLAATAVGEGNISAETGHEILVRRANLAVTIEGPPMKYAGGLGQYMITIVNDGDAPANGVTAVMAMPSGVKYLGGIKNAEDNNGGLKWNVGTLRTGDRKTFKVNCQLDASGNLTFQAGARGVGDLASTHQCMTKVDTIADLTLDVADPKGPLPTGEDVDYKIVIRNRGSRSANDVDVVMQFSEGIEPVRAEGRKSKIVTGQVVFAPISRIEPGQEIVLKVTAQANKSGTHIFRGQLTCVESDSREIDEGTTRFFGESLGGAAQELTLPSKFNTADASDELELNKNDFNR